MQNLIVAIDGPAGSGKSTIAKLLADKYKFTYIDTGAMYRMITFYFLEKKVNINDNDEIEKALASISLDMKDGKFILNSKDISKEIREPEVSNNVSKIASLKKVRENLVDLQRKISKDKNVILDGRDIGTVVFPNAQLKIFLVASAEERAKRRHKEFFDKGIEISYEKVLNSIQERDFIDSTREESPLIKAEDALELDTTNLKIEDVLNFISNKIEMLSK